MQESEQASEESGQDFGANTPESFASYDPNTLSWRTLQHSFIEELTLYSESWPRAGTMRNGRCYRLRPLVRLTDATEYSLWPTPTVADGTFLMVTNRKPLNSMRLSERVKWPTPTAHDVAHPMDNLNGNMRRVSRNGTGSSHSIGLTDAVRMWPTPTSRDWKSGTGASLREGHSPPLTNVVGGQLNPQFVEALMGFPIGYTDISGEE
jgi:hypothetical protein